MMTVTVADPDFNLFESDWKSRYKRYAGDYSYSFQGSFEIRIE